MNRRQFLATTAIVSAAAALPLRHVASGAPQPSAAAPPKRGPVPFDPSSVRQMAKDLAQKPFTAQDQNIPAGLKDIGYDGYRKIRFAPDRALWRNEGLPFQLQMFHRGFMYSGRVDLHEVVDGKASAIVYAPDLFTFEDVKPPDPGSDLGFAGFRIHAPINRPDYYDEVSVFLGASYFRAVAKGETYGLSARGLAINTADPKGEEFPAFRSFWIEKPQKHATSIVVHALLDSKSAAAAYRFTIRPGEATIYDVEMAVYPRVDIAEPGIAPMTSMFFFGPNDRDGVDDFRPAVHDSDGLAILNGRGEQLWRVLTNPIDLQISSFFDTNPRNFGLIQRQRDFAAYQDLESHFQTRPSLRVEPIGDWSSGEVRLIEIPTREEVHDNIVAFWRPKDPLKAKGEYNFTYRLHWGEGKPGAGLARFVKTATGAAGSGRLFVLDIAGDKLKDIKPDAVRGNVSANFGKISNVVSQPNKETGGWRLSFNLDPEKAPVVELRASLFDGDTPLSEIWVYRWTP
ncbi:glucan biosynthesis protein G [Undibacter mobilis]|uniref:Glucan biosynthesis protein G n=1 Tax=Undibacter mobilis TaxID=2292256 RepID=A0A371B3L9_9BRAD|nr:glucan biosynthesis protein G [Undibacter mobilis]RDV02186.1 glucan biosynthesis protein G [Undibacter mobilis]